MTVQELIEELKRYPGNLDVMIDTGNPYTRQGFDSVRDGTYPVFGKDVPCVMLSDKPDDDID